MPVEQNFTAREPSQQLLLQDRELAEVVRRLIEAYRPERIYLFGSKARGDADADSDYDLMVIVPDGVPEERRRSRLAYEVLWETGSAADVLVWTPQEFERTTQVPASLPATILREGKLLHAVLTRLTAEAHP